MRVTKRLLGRDSLLRTFPTQLPTPPPDQQGVDEAAAATEAERQKQEEERRQWREDVHMDFAALESTFIRIQFLKDSNEKERQRYAAEKVKILETAQAVRDNTNELRLQLQQAQETLGLRKTYDELADKITSNRMLKPRDEQKANLEKLNAEIAELEMEGREYGTTWAERKEQFGRIVTEGRQMMRLIRGEKDEPEKEEGMEDGEDGEGSTKEASRIGTPRPDMGGATPLPGDSSTPASQGRAGNRATSGLGAGTPAHGTSRAPSPARHGSATPMQGKAQDVEMAEAAPTPHNAAIPELEEGEAAEDSVEDGERMDVT